MTPVNKGTQSVVRHMLAIDWRLWKLDLRPSSAKSITIRMLERVAGIYLSVYLFIMRKVFYDLVRNLYY